MKLIPYLSFDGHAEEAMNFYAEVLGGEVGQVNRYSEAQGMPVSEGYENKVMHGQVKFGDNFIYFSDVAHREIKAGTQVSLTISFDSEEQIDRVFGLLSQGGTVLVPLDKQFWGAKYGKLTDKYGFEWDLNYQFQA